MGPIFFNQTVTAYVYRDLICQFVSLLDVSERRCWLQQDGATAHAANETMAFLREFFDNRPISKNLWPPRSPGLSPPDFYLWGYLKGVVYSNNPHTLDELKRNITTAVANIAAGTLRRVTANSVKRVRECVHAEGGYFQLL